MPAYFSNGVIERPGDADWFAVNLTGGQTYFVSSNIDNLTLNVRNPFGEVIRAPFDPAIGGYALRAPFGGNYYVEATSIAYTGPYSLAISEVPNDSIRGDTFTTATIQPGENYMVSFPSLLAARVDDDWYASNLTGGQSYLATTNSGSIYVSDAAGRVFEIDGGGSVQFTPEFGGRYYFGVSPLGAQVYTIRLDAVADDFADNRGTTGVATLGIQTRGNFETAGDEDWFRMVVDSSRTYAIATANSVVSVYDVFGNLAAENVLAFQPRNSGQYYLAASGLLQGGYGFTLTDASGGVPGNIFTTATLIPGDGPRVAQLLGRGDEDWYRVDPQVGQSYKVSADPSVTISIYDLVGNPAYVATVGDVRTFTATGVTPYYVAVSTNAGAPQGYGISLAAYTDDLPANFLSPARLTVGTPATGTFETSGDRDWFGVELRSNVSYYFESTATVVLRDASGNPVNSTPSDTAVTPQFNGLYYLEAVSTTQMGSYTVAVRTYTDDFADNVTTRGRLTEGGDIPGGGGTPGNMPTSGDDSLTGTAGADTIDGLAGNDTIRGLGGDDLLAGGPGNDLIDGGDGSDTADFSNANGIIVANLTVGTAQGTDQGSDTFLSIENLRGGAGDDRFTGANDVNIIEDRIGGNETFNGLGGDDVLTVFRSGTSATVNSYSLIGFDGNDTITVDGNGAGDMATIDGGAGADIIDLRDLGNTTVDLGEGNDRATIDVRTGNYAVQLGTGVDTIIPLDRGTTPRLVGAIGLSGFNVGAASIGGDTVDLRPYLASVFTTYSPTADPFVDGRVRLLDIPAGVAIQIDRDGTGTAFGFETLIILGGVLSSAGFTPNNILTGASGGGGGTPNTIAGTPTSETLTGTPGSDVIAGLAGNDVLIGNGGDDTLSGGSGDDTLMGGSGIDRLDGGAGFDTYLVEETGDVVVEARSGGFADIVFTTVDYVLPSDAEIENFAAAQGNSTVGMSLTGNQYGQAIAGTYGNDVIDGGGATINGGDILIGLFGDDLYYVDALSALLIENPGEGTDTAIIRASASGFILNAASGYVENLTAAPGSAVINITGNALSQTINGNDGANILSTGGGAPDTLNGGLGDDIYRLYGGGDVITDTGGTDAIFTTGSFRLTGSAGIELISTAIHLSAEAIDLTGNDAAQTLIGNFGANTLDGRGGNDTLAGLAGSDTFRFSTALGPDNVDTVQDFSVGDSIALTNDIFSGVGAVLTTEEFFIGSSPTSTNHRILYDEPTGNLFYDADGTGLTPPMLFAMVPLGTMLSASNFIVVAPDIGG